jgi:hypothetical protein
MGVLNVSDQTKYKNRDKTDNCVGFRTFGFPVSQITRFGEDKLRPPWNFGKRNQSIICRKFKKYE